MAIDVVSEYQRSVANIMKTAMRKKDINAKTLRDRVEKDTGINFSEAALSTILNPDSATAKYHMALPYIAAICQVLEIDMSQIALAGNEKPGNLPMLSTNSAFVSAPADPMFKGYVDKTFDIFFLSTGTEPREAYLHRGTMKLSSHDNCCKIEISIQNNPGEPWFDKRYTGKMFISRKQLICCCTVTGEGRAEKNIDKWEDLGDICYIIFKHRKFTDSDGFCARMALVNTVSANEQRPTVHRMIIVKQGSVDLAKHEHEAFIRSQLKLNRAKIIISEDDFNEIAEQQKDNEIMQLLKDHLSTVGHIKSFYVLQEHDLLEEIHDKDDKKHDREHLKKCYELLSLLRLSSVSHRYNKIGDKVDENLFKFLFS